MSIIRLAASECYGSMYDAQCDSNIAIYICAP